MMSKYFPGVISFISETNQRATASPTVPATLPTENMDAFFYDHFLQIHAVYQNLSKALKGTINPNAVPEALGPLRIIEA